MMTEQNQNATQNPNGTNNQGNNGNPAPAPAQPAKKDNFIVAGLKRAGKAVSDGWNAIKASPWTHALTAFGGVVGGGYLGYRLAESMRPVSVPAPDPVPQIPEPEKTDDEQTNSTAVEYVDIPENSTTPEE